MCFGLVPPSAGDFRPRRARLGCRRPIGADGVSIDVPCTRSVETAPSPTVLLTCALLLFGASIPSLAHKVVTSAWAEDDAIVGEVGLSNGEMAAAGTKVEVFGPDGAKQGEVFTDDEGMFRFVPQQAVEHRFEINLGAGHAGAVVLTREELPVALLRRAAAAGADEADAEAMDGAAVSVAEAAEQSAQANASLGTPELESLIARAVQRELRPLRKEFTAYQEKNDLQGILGGIGYICGVFGLLFFVAARRRLSSGPSSEQRPSH